MLHKKRKTPKNIPVLQHLAVLQNVSDLISVQMSACLLLHCYPHMAGLTKLGLCDLSLLLQIRKHPDINKDTLFPKLIADFCQPIALFVQVFVVLQDLHAFCNQEKCGILQQCLDVQEKIVVPKCW